MNVQMKKIILMSLISLGILSTMNIAVASTQVLLKENVINHSGGCRKSSPAGQCCHAGSQPLHCH